MTHDALARQYQALAEAYAKLADELRKTPPAPEGGPVRERLTTVRAAAARLGFSETYLYRRVQEFPFMRKHGRNWRVSEQALDEYVRTTGRRSDAG